MCSSRDKIIQTVETNFELQPFKDEAVRVIDLPKFPGDFESPNGVFNYILKIHCLTNTALCMVVGSMPPASKRMLCQG